MCNHYRADPDWPERTGEFSDLKIRTRFAPTSLAPGNNRPPLEIYPGRRAPVIRAAAGAIDGQDLEQVDMRWGFIPGSYKGPINEFRMHGRKHVGLTNCRDPRDQNDGQANFYCRWAYKERRCLVPAIGFYECDARGEKGSKQEFIFTLPQEPVFFLAGLWEQVNYPDGPVDSFAFMTTTPGEVVRLFHPKAEPVILEGDDWKAWLDHSADLIDLIRHSRPERLAVSLSNETA